MSDIHKHAEKDGRKAGHQDLMVLRTINPVDDIDSDLDSDGDEVIDDPLEWKDLVANITLSNLTGTITKSQLNMALRLLKGTLTRLFKTPSITKLLEGSTGTKQRTNFSIAATEESQGYKWSRTTAQKAFRVMIKVLDCTMIDPSFTHTIKLLPAKKEWNLVMGRKYSRRASDDPARMKLESWILVLKERTKCKSDLSMRNIMYFFIGSCLPAFGLDLDAWPDDAKSIVTEKFDEDTAIKLCQGKSHGKKLCWLQVFLTSILDTTCVIDKCMRKRLSFSAGDDDDDDDGADHHRISTGDLDKMFLACKKLIPQHMLMFMLMITTGIRVGGLTNIRIARVAKLEGNQWVVNDMGRTICKNKKVYRFALSPEVKDLVAMWLHNHRPADPTPFLFPGRDGGKISTSTVRGYFKKICLTAELDGKQFHPHSLRHSFAHILLESGNSSSVVASLMNHASSTTTEKFYLKESAEQLTQRASIPWMKDTDKKRKREPTVPAFLDDSKHVKANQKKKERKTKRDKKNLASLAMFKPLDNL